MELLCGEFGYASEDIPSQAILEALVAGKDANSAQSGFLLTPSGSTGYLVGR